MRSFRFRIVVLSALVLLISANSAAAQEGSAGLSLVLSSLAGAVENLENDVSPDIAGEQAAEEQSSEERTAEEPVSEGTEDISDAPLVDRPDGIYSILLIGSDRRDDSWNGNSDTMILATVNQNVNKLFLVSFMRDLYADIPGVGVRKLNNAFAVGGISLLKRTLETNYHVLADNYAVVDFENMEDIIDMVGGVDIDVRPEETYWVNGYINSLCENSGRDPYYYYIEGSGPMHLNGIQAVAYMRIRFVGNNDYERTERQRKVLLAIPAQLDMADVTALPGLLKEVLVDMDTDLTQMDLLKLLPVMVQALGYEIVQDRIPYDGMYYSKNEILVPDMEATVERLTSQIYAVE